MSSDTEPLGPPKRFDLPCFVYGVFKAGELAHYQVERFLAADPVEVTVSGALYVRDGLPLLSLGGSMQVRGSLLSFTPEGTEEAYRTIGRLEPRHHYRWQEPPHRVGSPAISANLLIGRNPEKGSQKSEQGSWSSREDPVFTHALEVVESVIRKDGQREFEALISETDWNRFFRLQMAYLLLWSSIERFTALRFGAALEPGHRIAKMGNDPAFAAELYRVRPASRSVVDSRKPTDKDTLSASEPADAVQYYYRVRSNLSHRGKGAWADGETVRRSLRELAEIFRGLLRAVWATQHGVTPVHEPANDR